MKNALLLGLAAAVLFAVSAGLSFWLHQPRTNDSTANGTSKSTAKKAATTPEENRDKTSNPGKPVVAPTPNGDASEPIRLAAQLQTELAVIAKREQEFERQQELYQVVIEDLRHEMEMLQKHFKQTAGDQPKKPDRPTLPPLAPDPAKKAAAESADATLQNLRLATGITESMQPENAAKIIEQLAKSGKTDTAVQLLAKLNPRQSAKILALITDEKLSAQLFERLLAAKAPAKPSP